MLSTLTYVSKDEFNTITPGTQLQIRYIIDKCVAYGYPILGKEDTIEVDFISGPFNGRRMTLIRQQIHKIL